LRARVQASVSRPSIEIAHATARLDAFVVGRSEGPTLLLSRAYAKTIGDQTLLVSTELTVGCYSEEWWLEGIGRVMKACAGYEGMRGKSIVRSRTVLHICNPL
jgi:hypothetical protein